MAALAITVSPMSFSPSSLYSEPLARTKVWPSSLVMYSRSVAARTGKSSRSAESVLIQLFAARQLVRGEHAVVKTEVANVSVEQRRLHVIARSVDRPGDRRFAAGNVA